MKRGTALYWLIGIAIAEMAITLSFHFDDSVRDFIMQHQNAVLRNCMRYVSMFGDWPTHAAVGLVLLVLAWRRGQRVDTDFPRNAASHAARRCGRNRD